MMFGAALGGFVLVAYKSEVSFLVFDPEIFFFAL